MSVIDVPPRDNTAVRGALECRKTLRSAIDICEHSCERVRRAITKYGKTEIAAELGDDAAGLQVLYDKLKTLVEDYGRTVEEL